MRIDDLLSESARRFGDQARRRRRAACAIPTPISTCTFRGWPPPSPSATSARAIASPCSWTRSYAAVVTLFAVARAGRDAPADRYARQRRNAPPRNRARAVGGDRHRGAPRGGDRRRHRRSRARCAWSFSAAPIAPPARRIACLSRARSPGLVRRSRQPAPANDAPAVALVAHPENQLAVASAILPPWAPPRMSARTRSSRLPSSLGSRVGLAAVVGAIAAGATLVARPRSRCRPFACAAPRSRRSGWRWQARGGD